MNTNHTPGSWKQAKYDARKIVDSVDEEVAKVFSLGFKGGDPEWQANAQLIASAPTMLEALERIQAEVSRTPDLVNLDSIAIYSNEAIARATGDNA